MLISRAKTFDHAQLLNMSPSLGLRGDSEILWAPRAYKLPRRGQSASLKSGYHSPDLKDAIVLGTRQGYTPYYDRLDSSRMKKAYHGGVRS